MFPTMYAPRMLLESTLPVVYLVVLVSRASKYLEGRKVTELCVVSRAMGSSCWPLFWGFWQRRQKE
jgi:hypothetical protein